LQAGNRKLADGLIFAPWLAADKLLASLSALLLYLRSGPMG